MPVDPAYGASLVPVGDRQDLEDHLAVRNAKAPGLIRDRGPHDAFDGRNVLRVGVAEMNARGQSLVFDEGIVDLPEFRCQFHGQAAEPAAQRRRRGLDEPRLSGANLEAVIARIGCAGDRDAGIEIRERTSADEGQDYLALAGEAAQDLARPPGQVCRPRVGDQVRQRAVEIGKQVERL